MLNFQTRDDRTAFLYLKQLAQTWIHTSDTDRGSLRPASETPNVPAEIVPDDIAIVILSRNFAEIGNVGPSSASQKQRDDISAVFLRLFEKTSIAGDPALTGDVNFIGKSVGPAAIVDRLKTLIGNLSDQMGTPSDEGLKPDQVGQLGLNRRSCRATWRGEELILTVTEFRIIEALASRPGIDISYRCLYDLVHGASFLTGQNGDGYRVNMRSTIRRIRKKFVALDQNFEEIENYHGFGYRWRISKPGAR